MEAYAGRSSPADAGRRVAVIGAGHYRATLSPNSMKILPDENRDNGAVGDPNRDTAEHRVGIDDQACIRAVFKIDT